MVIEFGELLPVLGSRLVKGEQVLDVIHVDAIVVEDFVKFEDQFVQGFWRLHVSCLNEFTGFTHLVKVLKSMEYSRDIYSIR